MSIPNKSKKKRHHGSGLKTGMAPGTMVFIGDRKLEKTRIDLIDFSETTFNELRDVSIAQCMEFVKNPGVTWINVNGIHDVELISALGKCFDLHPLTLEDIVNTSQRLKTEDFQKYLFIVLKMMDFNRDTNAVDMEHVSLILADNFVISFLEDEGDVFDSVRDRLRTSKGRIRSMKADFLAYTLMDTVVDHYFLAVEHIGDLLEVIDDQILENPKPGDLKTIHKLKRDILTLRKAVWPLREEIGILDKSESRLMRKENKMFWRDLYDHTIQVIDMVETFRDTLGSMQDTYLSSMSNRMNEVMKVLSTIATIFMPLTFIAGVYGMNFKNMPELEWHWGYPSVLCLMAIVGVGHFLYFKVKKWI